MIKLEIESYCENCPDFKPETEKLGYYAGNDIERCETVVYCKHRNRCRGIAKYIEEKEKCAS